MLAVASRICGLHAQVMSSAQLSLWARVEDLDRCWLQRALWQDRTLVKTWAMRGTLHLLPADEFPLWQAVLSTSPRYLRPAAWEKYFGIRLADLDRLSETIGKALDGCVLTREELSREIQRLTGSSELASKIADSSWGTVLKPSAFAGRLCFGPSLGQRVRFTSPNTWLSPPPESVDPQVATATVARRFLAAYGPATCHDLARWWNGGGISIAKRWIASLEDEVTPVELEGIKAWMLAADARNAREFPETRSVRLLPGFDPYVVGASWHAEHLLPTGLRSRVYRPQGWISPVLLVNGRMEGTWKHEIKGSRLEVVIEPFAKIPTWAHRAAVQEAKRLSAFFECAPTVVWKN